MTEAIGIGGKGGFILLQFISVTSQKCFPAGPGRPGKYVERQLVIVVPSGTDEVQRMVDHCFVFCRDRQVLLGIGRRTTNCLRYLASVSLSPDMG